jgi:hypothetical protein
VVDEVDEEEDDRDDKGSTWKTPDLPWGINLPWTKVEDVEWYVR